MPTALYRLSSGEVVKISLLNQTFDSRDTLYWGVLVDPPTPDGVETREDLGDDLGPLRQLGFAKIWDGVNVRNATQPEIDTFAPAQQADEDLQDVDRGKTLLDIDPVLRRVLKAVIKGVLNEDDRIRVQWETFKDDVALANNLTDLKNAVALLPDLPMRTLSQAHSFILNQVDTLD